MIKSLEIIPREKLVDKTGKVWPKEHSVRM